MPVLETLTIAAGLGAFAFLAYYVKRRLATRGIEETTGSNLTAVDSEEKPQSLQR